MNSKSRRADKLSLLLELGSAGWGSVTLRAGSREYTHDAPYIYDSYAELAILAGNVLQGSGWMECRWLNEPGEHRWSLKRVDERVKLTILWFQDDIPGQSAEQGAVVFTADCSSRRFAALVSAQFARLLEEHGVDGYLKKWQCAFPQSNYYRLRRLLEIDNVG